ncbi:MAG TPA: ATP-binding protein [Bryobacteraceae bacterium]|nr:ATP-binding protein [Bryobacteraceae bacterium]
MGSPDDTLRGDPGPADRRMWDSRVVLLTGFGGLLLIVALAGVAGLRVLQQIRRDDDRIRTEFLLRNHLLDQIRDQLYLSGTYVRDYVLDPDPSRAEMYRDSLEQVRRDMNAAVAAEAKLKGSEGTSTFQALEKELADYWRTLDPVFQWDAATRRRRGYEFLRADVFPRRTAVLQIASRIGDLNEQQLNAGNGRIVTVLRQFQYQLLATLLATLVLGLGMAAFSARKILALERHAQARYEEVAAARLQLANLSARLVQAQETERRALSRELHDEIGQSLSAALVELRNLSGNVAAGAQNQVDVIKGLVEGTVRAVRQMALSLRPSMLDDLGLIPALKWQAREVSKRTSMNVTVVADPVADDLPDAYKTCIFRVVQEALHNCATHSAAKTVRVRVGHESGALLVSVEDDGHGFDTTHVKGMGLLGMEERAAQLGGTARVHSGPGFGTVVTVELPFHSVAVRKAVRANETDSHPVSG